MADYVPQSLMAESAARSVVSTSPHVLEWGGRDAVAVLRMYFGREIINSQDYNISMVSLSQKPRVNHSPN